LRVPDTPSATVSSDDGAPRRSGVGPPSGGGGPAPERTTGTRLSPTTRRRVKRTIQLIVAAFAINYLVLPQLARLGDAVQQLASVRSTFLVLGLGLQAAAFVAYAQLMRECLPRPTVTLPRMVRIQLSMRSLANVIPAGNAAASALGYRLLTLSGVRGADAGFALATTGLGSAVLLNLILWAGLLISIPLRGFSPIYVTAAVIGVFLIGMFFGLVISLNHGREQSIKVVKAVARKLRFVSEDRAAEVVQHLADRLKDLLSDKVLLRRVVIWGTLNWLLDAASLWVFLYAFGHTLSLDGLLVSFGLANLFAALPITPGGLGIVEGIYIPTLAGFGVPVATSIIAVPIYRLAQYWLPTVIGGFAYVSLRVGPWAIKEGENLERLRDVAIDAMEHPGSSIDWAERYGHRPRVTRGEPDLPPPAAPPFQLPGPGWEPPQLPPPRSRRIDQGVGGGAA
jgi:uncharacterized protein (TIRG00374 family)